MKKTLAWLLCIVLVVALAVPALAEYFVAVEVDGVPTMLVPTEGAPIVSASGEDVETASYEDIILTGKEDFDATEQTTYEELLASETLPMLFKNPTGSEEAVEKKPGDVWIVFDFALEGNPKALVKETGNGLELEFELDEDISSDDLLVAQYVNNDWMALDPEFYDLDGGILNIRLENEGMVAIFRGKMVVVPKTDVVTKYRPSVRYSGHPELVTKYFYVLSSVGAGNYEPRLRVAADQIHLVAAGHFSSSSNAAYQKLARANKLTDVCDNVNDVLTKSFPNVEADNLVVRDIFEIEVAKDTQKVLDENGDSCILLRFKYNIEEGDTFMVLEYIDGEWVALDAQYYAAGDGIVAFKMQRPGVVAFVVENK